MTDELIAQAVAAAGAWGGLAGPPELIQARENVVFRARLADGTEVALPSPLRCLPPRPRSASGG
ncbi:hypothetical protein [Mangrovicoccus ximenensis]|uniref:hypothetical protein n=1 Tax=Mangrovicoccus ximenensis TaxID=1911570 RepID=UPI000D35ABF7|nr:hypothetical protein [Mangrovicoccus ximenensis]